MAAPRELSSEDVIDPSRVLWAASVSVPDQGPDGTLIEADADTPDDKVIEELLRAQVESGDLEEDAYQRFMDEGNYEWTFDLDSGPFRIGPPSALSASQRRLSGSPRAARNDLKRRLMAN